MVQNNINSESLKVYLSNQSYARLLLKTFATLEQDRIYETGLSWDDYAKLTREDLLLLQTKRARSFSEFGFVENEDILENLGGVMAFSDAMQYLDYSAGMKYFLNRSVCSSIYLFIEFWQNLSHLVTVF